jgi:exopolysaccharide biosynthesis polyprenyl glycosylphosphotransferase
VLFSPKRLPFLCADFIVALSMLLLLGRPSFAGAGANAEHFATSAVFSFVFTLTAFGIGFYDRFRRFEWFNIGRDLSIAALLAFLVGVSYVYLLQLHDFAAGSLLKAMIAAWLATVVLHVFLGALLRANPYRFTVAGSSSYLDELDALCRRSPRFGTLYSHVSWQRLCPNGQPPAADALHAAGVSEIVLTSDSLRDQEHVNLAIQLLRLKCRVVDETTFYLQVFERLPIETITRSWVLERGIARRQLITAAAKRTLDILLATATLIVLSPLFVLIALSIRLSSPGPSLFVQLRQGRNMIPFKMYKFRTMHMDLASPDGNGGFTKNGDERVIPICRLLRRLHLDELPQLWNVIRGQMSLVGPRPEALPFAERMTGLIPLYELRYLARPGLTGYAQINQGYAMDSVVDTKRKLSYDLYYLCHHSIWTDFDIMIRTLFVLARGAR